MFLNLLTMKELPNTFWILKYCYILKSKNTQISLQLKGLKIKISYSACNKPTCLSKYIKFPKYIKPHCKGARVISNTNFKASGTVWGLTKDQIMYFELLFVFWNRISCQYVKLNILGLRGIFPKIFNLIIQPYSLKKSSNRLGYLICLVS